MFGALGALTIVVSRAVYKHLRNDQTTHVGYRLHGP